MWAEVKTKLNTAVSFDEYVEVVNNFLPHADQEI
jgi:hypothetical protein